MRFVPWYGAAEPFSVGFHCFAVAADLSEYDFSGMVPMRFELKRKDTSISLRLPEELLDAVRINAKRVGIQYQRFILLAIERAVKPS